MDAQPWWLVEQYPVVAKAYREVEKLQQDRAREKAEREAR